MRKKFTIPFKGKQFKFSLFKKALNKLNMPFIKRVNVYIALLRARTIMIHCFTINDATETYFNMLHSMFLNANPEGTKQIESVTFQHIVKSDIYTLLHVYIRNPSVDKTKKVRGRNKKLRFLDDKVEVRIYIMNKHL